MKNRNSLLQFAFTLIVLCSASNISFAQQAVDTTIKPLISSVYEAPANTVLKQNDVIKLRSGAYIEILDKSKPVTTFGNSTVQIFKDGKKFNLILQNNPTPIKVFVIKDVIESTLDGDFKGWDGNTSFKLVNGDTWQQDENSGMVYANLYRPAVTILRVSDGTYKIMIKGVKEISVVKRK